MKYGIWRTNLVALYLVLTVSACDSNSDSGDRAQLVLLRIQNTTSGNDGDHNLIYGPISVRAIPAINEPDFEGPTTPVDYGTLEIAEESAYAAVPSVFYLEVNGELFGDDVFRVDEDPADRWEIEIRAKIEQETGYLYLWQLEGPF